MFGVALASWMWYGVAHPPVPVVIHKTHSVHLKHRAISEEAKEEPKKQDCGPGYEPYNGGCAETSGKVSTEPVKDELGYPKP